MAIDQCLLTEPPLRIAPAGLAREPAQVSNRFAHAVFRTAEHACDAVLDDLWHRAAAGRIRLPATDDPNYASLEALLHHVLRASRGYMTWMCERLGLPDPGIDPAPGPEVVAAEADTYLEHLLERWRPPLQDVEPASLDAEYTTRWGATLSIDAMLEHAVLHPVRHRFQLEELVERGGDR